MKKHVVNHQNPQEHDLWHSLLLIVHQDSRSFNKKQLWEPQKRSIILHQWTRWHHIQLVTKPHRWRMRTTSRNHWRRRVQPSDKPNMGPRNWARHFWPRYRWQHSYSYKKMNGTGMGMHTQNMGHKEMFPPRSHSKLLRCPRRKLVLPTQERPHRLPQHNPHPNPPTSQHTMVSTWRACQE